SDDAPSAFALIGAADAVREKGGMPRAPSLDSEVDAELTRASTEMSSHEVDALRTYGRTLDLAAAVQRALAVCEAAKRNVVSVRGDTAGAPIVPRRAGPHAVKARG
ncbi:MAG: hypothetical protein ABIS17_17240, partial [Casimicrobiaceae bacterium]